MSAESFDKIVVIGAGTMGAGIAQIFAQSGRAVSMIDRSLSDVERGLRAIESSLSRLQAKGKLDAAVGAAILGRISPSDNYDASADASLAVEAVFEDPELKRRMASQISAILPDDAIYASNTSSISITAIAAAAKRPERVIGMHFFNPVPVLQLVEVVRAEQTDDTVAEAIVKLARAVGKQPVVVNDYPGFVSNRILMPMINEAIFCLGEGVATKEAIDEVMKLGMGHPIGPLALADLVGLDVCLAILEVLQRDLGEDKYRPAPLLRRYVAAGKLGRKSGEGFYRYG